jgi:hypothetical protein
MTVAARVGTSPAIIEANDAGVGHDDAQDIWGEIGEEALPTPEALTELTRERTPLDCVRAQSGLGLAL